MPITRSRALVALSLPLLLACTGVARPASGTVGPEPRPSTTQAAEPDAHARALPDVDRVSVSWRRVAGGLSSPTEVTSADDGMRRLFVVEKSGTVRVFRKGQLGARPYLDISGLVSTSSERGLLSMAFPPDFRAKPRVFVLYTRGDGDVVVARFRADSARAPRVDASSRRTLLVVEHSRFGNHNGGQLAFGADRMLYVGIGDGGGGDDAERTGQDRTTLKGKVLRLDVSCGKPYCVPRDNPFAGATPGKGEIWLLGLRNPWRMSFDPATRALWIGDVGQSGYEEVNRVAARPSDRNLGWSCREGFTVLFPDRCRDGVDYVDPVTVVPHEAGESITGGFVYRGARYRDLLGGLYVFGDFVNRKVWVFAPGQGKRLQSDRLGPTAYAGPTSFGRDDAGELWAVTYDGTLWRMRAESR